jgi:hypothetical protein
MECTQQHSATILPFRQRAPVPAGLSVSDRIQVLRWSHEASRHGLRATQIHEPEPGDDPSVGPFVLVYRNGDDWAAWGLARKPHGYELWSPANFATIGVYDTIGAALCAISVGPALRL